MVAHILQLYLYIGIEKGCCNAYMLYHSIPFSGIEWVYTVVKRTLNREEDILVYLSCRSNWKNVAIVNSILWKASIFSIMWNIFPEQENLKQNYVPSGDVVLLNLWKRVGLNFAQGIVQNRKQPLNSPLVSAIATQLNSQNIWVQSCVFDFIRIVMINVCFLSTESFEMLHSKLFLIYWLKISVFIH